MGLTKRRKRRQIAIYGKGGIGKTTILSNLAIIAGMSGKKVLVIGCDPKHDTSYKITDTYPVPTVLESLQSKNVHELNLNDFLVKGRFNVSCIEAGGPEPGIGCAGRGISKMFEILESMHLFEMDFDYILYDVLGDVVCGGFAVPMRSSYASEVLIIISGEIMSLYAANNICRALVRLQNTGVRLLGFIGNLRNVPKEIEILKTFALRVGGKLLYSIPRDNILLEAEKERKSVIEFDPQSDQAMHYKKLYELIFNSSKSELFIPRPMGDLGFNEFIRENIFYEK